MCGYKLHTIRKGPNMKTHIVLTALLICAAGSAYGSVAGHGTRHVRSYSYLDSLIRAEFRYAPNDPVTWDLNKKLGMANFVLQDGWAWAKLLDAGKLDTDHNFMVHLVGQHDRPVGITEFRAAFAADMARADTILYNFRVLCGAREKHSKSHTVLFERAYETAYARNQTGAAIATR